MDKHRFLIQSLFMDHDVNKNGLNEKLVNAACSGDTAEIKKLLKSEADVNYQNTQINTVLMWAVTHPGAKAETHVFGDL